MPLVITANALQHFGLDEAAYCFCWRIVPRYADAAARPVWGLPPGYGLPEGYTSLDRSLFIDGLNYASTANVMPTSVPTSLGLDVDGVDATLLFPEAAQLQRKRVELGVYNGALVNLFAVPWEAFLSGACTSADIAPLLAGRLGEADFDDQSATFELLSWSAILEGNSGQITGDLCNCARFGRGRCKNLVIGDGVNIKLHGRTVSGQIVSPPAGQDAHGMRQWVLLEGARGDGWANHGVLRIAGGELAGAEFAVKSSKATGEILLRVPCTLGALPPGTPIELEEGCDRTLDMCLTKEPNPNVPTGEGNLRNFRGFRSPGQAKLVAKRDKGRPETSW